MVRKINNQLENNLPQLQNLIKRDPQSYNEDFLRQRQMFQGLLENFKLCPSEPNKQFEALVMFLSEVSHCYPKDLTTYPQELIEVLENYKSLLNNSTRMTFCKALILLRNKNLLSPIDLLELFFKLLQCQDKQLRTFLETFIISDIKNINSKHKNHKLNSALQNFMFSMLKDGDKKASKMSIDIMTELYKKNIWNDVKTVNVVATGCFSRYIKVAVASLKFFLGKDDEEKDSDQSDSDEEIDPKEVIMANKVNKKSRKREKQLIKVKKLASKAHKKKSEAPVFNFSALNLVHDPQGMAERLFKQLETTNKRFEVKLLTLDVISRLIGLHNLFLFSFYSYIQRFLQPHQREVTRLLQFAAQASHELVPPDVIEPLIKTIANNFVTERNSSDVMAIGLNAVREICVRCPLSMNDVLMQDFAEYKKYKIKSVMMAAKSLIQLFRHTRPELLHRKDRGRPSEASEEIISQNYGAINAKDYIPGAEVLIREAVEEEIAINSDEESVSNDEEWIDIPHSDEECGEGEDLQADKKELAQKVTLERILTDEDFKKIDIANLRKHVTGGSTGTKRKAEEMIKEPSELVKLGDIENIYKKRRHDKETRMESIKKGQEDRQKFGFKDGRLNEHCSKTNREKRKTKNYQMIKHKVKGKSKRSFKDKQIALRNHLLRLKKMK